jgi:hypothetical protein
MKRLMLNKAIKRLKSLKSNYQELIKKNYEYRAKDCQTCETQGICCTDAHFVNVHITRLEALAIKKTLEKLPIQKQKEIFSRNEKTIEKYGLISGGGTYSNKFACPLFEKGTGCLVHKEAKPVPCIQHACYENKADLPPEELQTGQEKNVERLNTQTFGNAWNWLPLPVWLEKVKKNGKRKMENQ